MTTSGSLFWMETFLGGSSEDGDRFGLTLVAGDFDKTSVKADIERLFGGLKRANVPSAPSAAAPKLPSVVRETMVEENIQLPKIIMAWHSPARFQPGDADLDVLSNVLDRGKTSRLYKALVFDKELAQRVSAGAGHVVGDWRWVRAQLAWPWTARTPGRAPGPAADRWAWSGGERSPNRRSR